MIDSNFQNFANLITKWIINYYQKIEDNLVLSQVVPDEIKDFFNTEPPPVKGKGIQEILAEFDKHLYKGITHWNHPGFLAYFNSTSSEAGILSEYLISALNLNGMLWKTSPLVTELEYIVTNWLRTMVGLSDKFWGIIYDTASISTFYALVAAREQLKLNIKDKGLAGRNDLPKLLIYCSEHAHSSVEKSAIAMGLGLENVRKIRTNEKFEIIPDILLDAINSDLEMNGKPFCVIATVGTTSFASIDPVVEISKICKKHNLWLHIDAAYAGTAAILTDMKWITDGWENADSIVINPHKWMFTPMDCSILFTKKKNILKEAFSLVPEYLKSSDSEIVDNLMDYGLQLGRRFRALKLWFVINHLGVEGIENKIRNHINWAKDFAYWIEKQDNLKLINPVFFSTICFQFVPSNNKSIEYINFINQKLLNIINSSGKIFLSHTKYNDLFLLRLTIGSYWHENRHIELAKEIIKHSIQKILSEDNYNQL